MPRNYFKLDLYFFEHPKVVDLSHAATVLFLASIAYSNRRETDGFIARPVVRKLIEIEDAYDQDAPTHDELAQSLVKAELWQPVEGGWQIHDFFDHNDSSEERAAKRDVEREGNRERQRRHRARHAGDPSVSSPSNDASRPLPTVTNAVSHPIEVEVTEAEAESAATPRVTLAIVEPSPETAQTVLGAYIDWRRARGVNGIDRRTTGILAKQLGEAFAGGHPPDIIRLGLADWDASDTHPSTLGSFIDTRARGGQPRAGPGRDRRQMHATDQVLAQWAAEEVNGGGPNGVAPDRRPAQCELARPADHP